MFQQTGIIQCPIQGPVPFIACPDEEVTPLVEHLELNHPVTEPTRFPRGTLLPDGRLDLCKQSLGPNGCQRIVRALKGSNQIKSLLLGTDGIGDQGAAAVGDLLQSNSTLRIVYLGCNGITETGATSLADSLAENTSVEGLWLKRNPIGDQGVEKIAALVNQNRSIRVLDLVNTAVGERGLELLCESLKSADCSIERIYLGGNALGKNSAIRLADVLRVNQRLRCLLLNVGELGDEGAASLADGLADNQTLWELGIASNGITARGLEPLMASLTHHRGLMKLDLGYSPSTKVLGASANMFGDEGGRLIGSMLDTNDSLRHLNLSKTSIGEAGKECIESGLLANRTIHHCIVDGGFSKAIQLHLTANRERDGESDQQSSDMVLIRSVYRNAKRTHSRGGPDGS